MPRFYYLIHGLLLLLSVAKVHATPLKPIRFQLDWYPDAERGGFICALVNGYYRDAGLDVQIIPASPNLSPLGPLLAGKIDLFMDMRHAKIIANNIQIRCALSWNLTPPGRTSGLGL